MDAKIQWNADMLFQGASEDGHAVMMDSSEKHGGKNSAPRPKELILQGLGGCTGMDVISILKKMRNLPEKFRMEIHADQTDEHPRIFKNIHIKYYFSGELDREKVARAVELSQKQYCGVSEMLRRSSDLTHEIIYE